MAKHQKSYTPEFKEQIVELYNTGTTSYPKLEREYGVNKSTIYTWVKQLSHLKISDTETISMKEFKSWQKKIRSLEIENEILKKATAMFANNQHYKY